VGLTQGLSSLWRHKRRLEGNVQIILQELGYDIVDFIHLAVDRLEC